MRAKSLKTDYLTVKNSVAKIFVNVTLQEWESDNIERKMISFTKDLSITDGSFFELRLGITTDKSLESFEDLKHVFICHAGT